MKRFSFGRLRVRLIILVLLAIIPALGLTLYTGLEQRQIATNQAKDEALRLAHFASSGQRQLIQGAHQFLYILAQLPQVRSYDTAACSRLFADILKQYPHYLNIGAIGLDGYVFASAIPLPKQINVAYRPYFQRALKTKKFTVGEYQIGRITGKPGVNLGYPVMDDIGKVKAVVYVVLDLTWLNKLSGEADLPDDSTLSLIDSDSTILARYPESEKWVGKTMPEASVVKTILTKGEGIIETIGADGVKRLYAFTSFGSTENQADKIYVSIGTPSSAVFVQVNRILIRNLAFLLFISLLALSAAWFGGNLLVLRQLNPIVSTAKRLGAGDLSARTGIVCGKGELSQLAFTFDEMAESLEKHEAERKRAEEVLKESERRYRQVVENATEIIYTVDEKGNFTYGNPAGLKVTGYSLQELRELNYTDLVLPEHRERVMEIYIKQFRERQATTYVEFPFFKKSGEIIWFGQNASLVIEDGKVVGFHIIARDITERKQAAEQLQKMYRKLSTLYAIDYAASQSLELEEVLRAALDATLKVLNIESGGFFLLEPDGVTMILRVHQGFSDEFVKNVQRIKLGEGVSGRAAAEKRPVVLDVADYPSARLAPFIVQEGIQTLASTPLLSGGKLVGAMNLVARRPRAFPPDELELLASIGVQLGGVIQNAQLYEAVQRELADRKQAEEDLKQSEERYRAVANSAIDSIITTDNAGIIIGWNQGAEHTFGFNETEILGQSLGILMPESYREAHTVGLNRIQKGGEPRVIGRTVELEGKRKNGSEFPLELSLAQWETTEGQFFTGIARDITERKRAEEALKASEEKYRTLVESTTDGILMLDKERKVVSCNQAFLDLFGYDRNEIEGKPIKIIHPSDDSFHSFGDLAYTTIEKVGFFRAEWDFIRKDGTIFPAETVTSVIRSYDRSTVGFVAIIRDSTERKRAEEALRSSEEKYRTILENIEDGYFEVDIAGNFTFFNDSMCRIYGYPIEELMGMNDRQYTDQENAEKLFQAFNKVYRTGEPTKEVDWEIIGKDGKKRSIEASVSLLKDPSGNRIGFRGIVRDITKRKRAEGEKAILEEQLRQSQKIEAVGRLAGGIAHDFNNLLTVIKGYSQLSLIELKEDAPLRGNIEEIKRASEKAADLTRQLLAFSRRQILEMRVLDLNTVLRDMDKMLHRLIGEDIELITLLADDLGRVKTDPGWVEQIIMNLAINARDAMPSVGKLTIETANVELDGAYARNHIAVTPGRYVMLSVSDTGVGMVPEVRQQVFEPFFTTKEKGKGTGLGLSTVYGIVKQSGGNIWVYSEPGQGTTFKIYLPRVDEPLEELKEKVVKEELPRGSETILLVEDEEVVRKLAVRILKRQGYTVLEGSHGNEAIDVCKQHKRPVHLLLTDVVMPKMSGRELAERFKPLYPKMKVLYMSGYTDNAITHHGVLEEGMNYLQKPFTVDGLARKVREVLDK